MGFRVPNFGKPPGFQGATGRDQLHERGQGMRPGKPLEHGASAPCNDGESADNDRCYFS